MAVDNKQLATEVLGLVGGSENVNIATNCMTRLRLTLKDNSKADVEAIKNIKGVLGCQFSGSQLQVIVGPGAAKVLDAFVEVSGATRGEEVNENLDADLPKEKMTLAGFGNLILDYLSGSMTQLIPLIMAGGLFRTIAVLIGPICFNLVSDTDPTYTFLYTTMYEAAFTFLPIYLGYACAKKLGCSVTLGMLCGGVAMAPSIITAAGAGENISVYGFQLAATDYSQSVLPILLTIPVLYWVEKYVRKFMPDTLQAVFTPFVTMIIIVPIELIVLAPIGAEIGTVIANAIFGLANFGGIALLIVMAFIGALWQLFVVGGMHMPIIMLAIVQITAVGYDPFLFVSTNCAMFAVWGCAIGAFLKIKEPDEKGLALGYVVAALAGGVTEPALFGVVMRFRRTMLGMFAGGAAGAIVSGILGVTYYMAGGGTNLLVFLNYVQGGTQNIIFAVIGCVVSVVVAAIVTFLFGFSKEELEAMES